MLLKGMRVHVAVSLRGGDRIESRICVAFLASPCAFTCVAVLCLPYLTRTCTYMYMYVLHSWLVVCGGHV